MESPTPSEDGEYLTYNTNSNAPELQNYSIDADTPNDMLIDSDEYMNDGDSKDDVAIIDPDELGPRADDCMCLYIFRCGRAHS